MTPDVAAIAAPHAAYDKTGRKIEVGDVLKVFHFRGGRYGMNHFMYKQVIGVKLLGSSGFLYFQVSHLNMQPFGERDGGYYLAQDGHHYPDIEIVQGLDYYHERPRVKALLETQHG